KSGFTPLSLPLPDAPMPYQALFRLAKERKSYQREWLNGFTSKELRDLGAAEDADTKPSELSAGNVPIHPLYRRRNWLPSNLPLGHGLDGDWDADNDTLWTVLEPILRLASLFLSNSHVWPWPAHSVPIHLCAANEGPGSMD
ncbi:hypothetical protein B0J14DRAFT_484849, partial [Halenospora varia]